MRIIRLQVILKITQVIFDKFAQYPHYTPFHQFTHIFPKQFQRIYSFNNNRLYNFMYSDQNAVSDWVHQPQQAFLFRPYHSGSPKQRDDFKIGEGKSIRRLLFDGWAQDTYTPYQLEQIQKLDQYLQKKGIQIDPRWNRPWRLRYMLSTGCNLKKCEEDMEKFMGYIGRVKELHMSRNVAHLLAEGAFYIMGKDCHYRPILVFDAQRLVRLKPTEDQLEEMQVYFFEYVIKNYLIPGQVENWIALVDSGYQGLFSMVDTMKKAFGFLANTYRSRLFAAYNVRITTSISIIWGIVKRFLQPETVEKINLFDQNIPEPLLEYAHPSQIEVKYGGTMPNIPQGSYWPPKEWKKCKVDYMTKEQYTELYNSGTLRDTKIHQANLILPASTELGENHELQVHEPQIHELQILKKVENEFRSHLEDCSQDRIVFEKDIEPYTKLPSPVTYGTLLAKMAQHNKEK